MSKQKKVTTPQVEPMGELTSPVAAMLSETAATDDTFLDIACDALLAWVKNLDPVWRNRLEALQDERHWDARTALGALVGHALDTGDHMAWPAHDYFKQGHSPSGLEALCPGCGRTWKLRYAGEPFCSNECADASRQPAMPAEMPAVEMPRPAEEIPTTTMIPPVVAESATVEGEDRF